MRAKVTAIIVTFNARDEIGQTLSALRSANATGELDCIVVDNLSSDGTTGLVRDEHPWVTVVENRANIGYGRGLNVGLALASTKFVLLMNPDAVIEPWSISVLARFLEDHQRAGVVAPAIEDGHGGLQSAGAMPTPWQVVARALGVGVFVTQSQVIWPGQAAFRTNWICGALMLARTDLLRRIGGFDPRYFLYFEETDLCRRVAMEGFELWAVGEAVASHVGGVSARRTGKALASSCIAEHYYRSRHYFLRKFHGLLAAVGSELVEYPLLLVRSVVSRLRGREDDGLRERLRGPFLSMPQPIDAASQGSECRCDTATTDGPGAASVISRP